MGRGDMIGNLDTTPCAVHTGAIGRVSGIAATVHLSIFLESRSFFTHGADTYGFYRVWFRLSRKMAAKPFSLTR
jgi:hypothetical protein